jgi:hypothetical protein
MITPCTHLRYIQSVNAASPALRVPSARCCQPLTPPDRAIRPLRVRLLLRQLRGCVAAITAKPALGVRCCQTAQSSACPLLLPCLKLCLFPTSRRRVLLLPAAEAQAEARAASAASCLRHRDHHHRHPRCSSNDLLLPSLPSSSAALALPHQQLGHLLPWNLPYQQPWRLLMRSLLRRCSRPVLLLPTK